MVFSEASTVRDNERSLEKGMLDIADTGGANDANAGVAPCVQLAQAPTDGGAAAASGQDSMPSRVYIYNLELLSLLIQTGNGEGAFQELMAH